MSKIPFVKHQIGWFQELEKLLIPDKPVEVYRNLHLPEAWSVRQRQDGKMRVRLHTDYIVLRDCKFVVRKGGRDKVLKERRKNVHAFVKGILMNPVRTIKDENGQVLFDWQYDEVSYNPYKGPTFYVVDDQRPTLGAKWVDLGFAGLGESDVRAFCP